METRLNYKGYFSLLLFCGFEIATQM